MGARGDLRVPTLDGAVEVSVPPGTQPEEVLRLRGKGLADLSGGRGDLNLRIRVPVPEHFSAAERDLYEQLRALKTGRRERKQRHSNNIDANQSRDLAQIYHYLANNDVQLFDSGIT